MRSSAARGGAAIACALALTAAAACGGSEQPRVVVTATVTTTVQAKPEAPPPPIARFLPDGYRARSVERASLSGGSVPDAVVSSVGPPTGDLNLHPANVQVLSWDGLAERWTVIFDAQKVIAPDTFGGPTSSNAGPGWSAAVAGDEPRPPILDPTADVTLGAVRFGSLLGDGRQQLVFSATLSYGGSGVPTRLSVVDFADGVARVVYSWSGEGLDWQLKDDRIQARASYWTRADAHCCPSREYRFTLAAHNGYLVEVADERPYLGVLVRQLGGGAAIAAPLQVIEVAEGAAAAGRLREGDVLLDVENAPAASGQDGAATASLYNKLSSLDAGQTARLRVERDGVQLTVSVKLGSLMDATGALIVPADDYSVGAL